jgi:hypothetical protein
VVNRWLWWAPLALITLGCTLFGLRMGWIAATTDETDVIMHFAEKYVQSHRGDAQLTDCIALPAHDIPGIWILVRCRPPNTSQRYEYYVNRFGGFEYGTRPDVPQTPVWQPQT